MDEQVLTDQVVLTATRRSLHGVAELVLAGPRLLAEGRAAAGR